MSAPNDGGPAFPSPPLYPVTDNSAQPRDGMSLRDWFAGQTLCGFMASKGHSTHFDPKEDAKYCYKIADAMLAERAKQRPTP